MTLYFINDNNNSGYHKQNYLFKYKKNLLFQLHHAAKLTRVNGMISQKWKQTTKMNAVMIRLKRSISPGHWSNQI